MGVVEADGEGTLLKIGADDIDWLSGFLIGLAIPFEVVRPSALRDQVREIALRVAHAHSRAPVA